MTTRTRPKSRYSQAEQALRTLLETGGYRPGDKLPTEPELARQLGVSRATLREALRSFEQQGVIARRQGVGTFVTPRPVYVESGLEILDSIEGLLGSKGLAPQVVERQLRHEAALPKAASRLHLPEGAALTVMSSTVVVGARAVAYLLEVAPSVFVPLEAIEKGDGSLLAWLLAEAPAACAPSHAIAHIAPVHGTLEICTALSVDPCTPLFFMEQTVYAIEGTPCYYARNYYVPELFDFHVIRRREGISHG